MATSNNKIKEVSVVQKTTRVDNSVDSSRDFSIRADLTVNNGNLSGIQNGEVITLSESNPQQVATFNKWPGGGLNVQFTPTPEHSNSAILVAIDEFNANCEAFVKG